MTSAEIRQSKGLKKSLDLGWRPISCVLLVVNLQDSKWKENEQPSVIFLPVHNTLPALAVSLEDASVCYFFFIPLLLFFS